MGLTTTAAKWGLGPTVVATMIGGAALGASVAVYEFTVLGQSLGAVTESAPLVGPAMDEGSAAVRAKIAEGAGPAGAAPAPAAPAAPAPAPPAP